MNLNPIHHLIAALSFGKRRLTADEYRYARNYFSQNGEDIVIQSLFPDKGYIGFYVDVGAHHPTRFSNTALLAKRGWRGINIDPLPSAFRAFQSSRPGDINLCMGIAASRGNAPYLMHREPAFNRLALPELEGVVAGNIPNADRTMTVEVDTLAAVLEKHLPAGRKIDLLTVDCEGLDEQVLRSNDWARFRPTAVCVEDWQDDPESSLLAYMTSLGYRQVAHVTKSRIFTMGRMANIPVSAPPVAVATAGKAHDTGRAMAGAAAAPQRGPGRRVGVPTASPFARARRLRRALKNSWGNLKILAFGYGQFKTMLEWAAVDASGNPIPWFTYPAIEYLRQLDLSDARVFEYGSGNSSIYWATRCRQLVTVEDDAEWAEAMRPRLPGSVNYLVRSGEDYPRAILETDDRYDIIVVDGSRRKSCARFALERLSDTGFIIVDNSDWMPNTTALLRESGLIQVDMSGFGPINGYTLTTSFFLTRNVVLRPVAPQQPTGGPGSIRLRDPSADS